MQEDDTAKWFEVSDPLTNASLTVPFHGDVIFNKETLQGEFGGVSLKTMFLLNLFLIETSPLAPEADRKQAALIKTPMQTTIKEIHVEYPKVNGKPSFRFELENINEWGIAQTRPEVLARRNEIQDQINTFAEAGKIVPVELVDQLNKWKEEMRSITLVGDPAQTKLIRSIYENCVKQPVVQKALDLILLKTEDLTKVYKPKKERIKPTATNRSATFRRGGHLEDQTLKVSQGEGISAFPINKDRLMSMLATQNIALEDVIFGIQLTSAEQKIIDSLCRMLHEKSQNTTPNSKDYYTGNLPAESVPYGPKNELAPMLGITFYEITKAYLGDELPSGKDIQNVRDIVFNLAKKRFYIDYPFFEKNGKNGRQQQSVQDVAPLIYIRNLQVTEWGNDDLLERQNDEWIVALNPIFRHQIDTKFTEVPSDIIARTNAVCGSSRVPESTIRLRNYLIRQRSTKTYHLEIYQDKLFSTLCPEYVKKGRRKLAGEFTKRAIDSMVMLGILQKWEVVPGSTGQPKILLTINRDWI